MTRATADQCYEAAGIGPEDVSVAYCHDAFVNEELEYYELLGFCAEGEGEKLVAEGATGPGGRIPFNTDGGLLARGHPGGPTGLAMIHEAVLQLRGEADGRQVDSARVALAHLVGGGSVATVNLLGTEGRAHDHERGAPGGGQGDPGPAVAGHPDRSDRAVPGGQAGAGLLRPRPAERVRRHLDAPGPAGARPLH